MNTETYEQIHLDEAIFSGDAVNYLIPQLQGESGVLRGKAAQCRPAAHGRSAGGGNGTELKGATVSNVTKPAKLESGLVVQVPPFISQGERIRVNTTDGSYQERA